MFLNAKALLVIVSSALVAQAQSSPSSTAPAAGATPTLDSCITDCVGTAAISAGCVSFTNLTCVCTSTPFQESAAACLQANCTSTDLQTAEALQSAECGSLSTSGASSATSTPASSGTSASSSTGSASSSATSSSAAMALSAPLSFGSLVGTLIASAGVLVGAAIVL